MSGEDCWDLRGWVRYYGIDPMRREACDVSPFVCTGWLKPYFFSFDHCSNLCSTWIAKCGGDLSKVILD